jgi:hypothetical protein
VPQADIASRVAISPVLMKMALKSPMRPMPTLNSEEGRAEHVG